MKIISPKYRRFRTNPAVLFLIACFTALFAIVISSTINYTVSSTSQDNLDEDLLKDLQSSKIIEKQTKSNQVDAPAIANTTLHSTKFRRYDGVVIVTKVLWDKSAHIVAQMVCYLTHAYNDKMKYDIIVFTTIPWTQEKIDLVQIAAGGAKVTVVVEGPSLEEHLAAMSKEEVTMLRNRCSLENKTDEVLSWHHYCVEKGSKDMVSLGYGWQAEFRAYHIWKHQALKNYKYMMWLDSDCRVGKEWDRDPIEIMVENDLTLMYSGYPSGKFSDARTREKLKQVYNMTLCYTKQRNGELYGAMCEDRPNTPALIRQVDGSHHITNLDHYRKDVHQRFLKSFVGDYKFSRRFDDQIAVTIVAVMEQRLRNETSKLWHERSKNITLKIAHHSIYDAQPKEKSPVNKYNFFHSIKKEWPGLGERCGSFNDKK
eukprot:scaffold10557_cov302-Chaetoceros_neogracile.AAC.6